MAKRVTHNVTRHSGKTKEGRNIWKQVGRVIHDEVTGKDVLWISPGAMRSILGRTDDDVAFALSPYNKPDQSAPPWKEEAPAVDLGHGPLCGCPTCQERQQAINTPHKYDEPPIDFDDDIPF